MAADCASGGKIQQAKANLNVGFTCLSEIGESCSRGRVPPLRSLSLWSPLSKRWLHAERPSSVEANGGIEQQVEIFMVQGGDPNSNSMQTINYYGPD